MDVPPCFVPGQPLNPCARQLYAWEVNGKGWLPADWAGWRLAGRYLVSPDGDRVSVERLRGLLFAETYRRKLDKQKAGIQGEVIDFARHCRRQILQASRAPG